jgi:hypothetical protein
MGRRVQQDLRHNKNNKTEQSMPGRCFTALIAKNRPGKFVHSSLRGEGGEPREGIRFPR